MRAASLAALTDREGAELIEAGRYEDVFAVRAGELYAAGERGAYRLFDASGKPLSDAVFAMIGDGGDALVFRNGDRYGAMAADGTLLLAAEWTQLTTNGRGGFLALDDDPSDETPDELIRIGPDGSAARTGVFVTQGLSRVIADRMPFTAQGGLCGAVDGAGRVAVEPLWRAVGAFENGLAKVCGEAGMGLIDAAGSVVLEVKYRWLERSGAMIAAIGAEGVEVYAPDGTELRFAVPGAHTEATLVGNALAVSDGNVCRLYDAFGHVLTEKGRETVFAAGVDGQYVASDGAWGETCQWLVASDGSDASGRFQQLLPLIPGRYAWLSLPGAEYYSEELERIQKSWDYAGMRYGLADSAGRVLLPAAYREILPLDADRLLLVSDGEIILADENGQPIRTWVTAPGEESTDEAGAGGRS